MMGRSVLAQGGPSREATGHHEESAALAVSTGPREPAWGIQSHSLPPSQAWPGTPGGPVDQWGEEPPARSGCPFPPWCRFSSLSLGHYQVDSPRVWLLSDHAEVTATPGDPQPCPSLVCCPSPSHRAPRVRLDREGWHLACLQKGAWRTGRPEPQPCTPRARPGSDRAGGHPGHPDPIKGLLAHAASKLLAEGDLMSLSQWASWLL